MLVNRNITVGTLRTSVRLEPEFWAALTDISTRENMSIDQLCTLIDGHLGEMGRTAAIRVFIASYFAADQASRKAAQFERSHAGDATFRTERTAARRAYI